MKKLFVLIAVLVGTLSAQTVSDNGHQGNYQYYKITSWAPFSTDSVGTAFYSDMFDLSGADTVFFYCKGSSSDGSAKFVGGLVVNNAGGAGSTTNWDSVGVAADTTNVKTETLQYIGAVGVSGATHGRIRLTGSTVTTGTTTNRADAIANFYFAIHKP